MLFSSNGSASSNAPKNTIISNINPVGATVNNTSMFMNTTPGGFVNNMVVGVYGVGPGLVNTSATHSINRNTAPGWVVRRSGMGPVTGVTVSTGGSSYSNNDLFTLTGNGCLNTTVNVVTNSTGGVVGFTNFTNNAGLFPNSSFITTAYTNTTGGTANGSSFTVGTITLGGRANRYHNEVLVAMSSMNNLTSTTSQAFPNT